MNMNNKRSSKSRKNKNKNKASSKQKFLVNTGKANNGDSGRFGIPRNYPRPLNDVVPATLRCTVALSADGAGVASLLFVYGKGTSSGAVAYIDDFASGFNALGSVYARFIITELKLETRVLSNTVAGGFLGSNYEPTDTTIANPPTTITDVSNSVHYAMATSGVEGKFQLNPTQYFNDWKSTSPETAGRDAIDTQFGVSQFYGGGFTPLAAVCSVIDIELRVIFSGYRA